jgi:drug/metabolite transporter (DMT)-like permease
MNNKLSAQPWKAYSFLVLAQTMVGINIVGTKFLVESTPLLFLLAIRFLFATILLLPLHWILDSDKRSLRYHLSTMNKRDWLIIAAQAICAGTLFNILMIWGLRFTDANVAGIITSALPAIIAIMCWLILKEQFTRKKSLCVGLATLGLLIISLNNLVGVELKRSYIGDFLVLLALLPEATYYVLTKLKFTRLPIFLMSALMNGINMLILFPIMFLFVDLTETMPLYNWLIIIVIGLGTGLFYVFWFLGSEKVDAIMGSLSTAVMPIATVTIAWLVLGEVITWIQLAGMALVIGSIVIYARSD